MKQQNYVLLIFALINMSVILPQQGLSRMHSETKMRDEESTSKQEAASDQLSEEKLRVLASQFAKGIAAYEKSPQPTQLDQKVAAQEFTQSEAHLYYMTRHAKDLPDLQSLMQYDEKSGVSKIFKNALLNPPSVTTIEDVRDKEDRLIDYISDITLFPGYFGSLKDDFKPMLKRILAKEREFASNYVFYHGHKRELGLLFDVYREIENFLLHAAQIFRGEALERAVQMNIRLQDVRDSHLAFPYKDMADFMKRNTIWSDHNEQLRKIVRSTNLSLFGSTASGYKESSLHFLIFGINVFDSHSLDTLFDQWGFDKSYKDQLYKLYSGYIRGSGHQLLQIFVPADKVDSYVYISQRYGAPVNIKDVLPGQSKAINLPRSMDSKIILDAYRKNPDSVVDLDRLQGRIVLFPSFFDPDNGVKIFRHTMTGIESSEGYTEGIRTIVGSMMIKYILDHQKDIEAGSDVTMKNILKSILKSADQADS